MPRKTPIGKIKDAALGTIKDPVGAAGKAAGRAVGQARDSVALGTLFLTTSAFTLAKCVRDAQESQYVVSRLDQARVDRILAEHDPWKEVG